jgi:hypothetical protein
MVVTSDERINKFDRFLDIANQQIETNTFVNENLSNLLNTLDGYRKVVAVLPLGPGWETM